ncbi:MAG: FAD/NAD(P)-binding protein [Acidimicrobiales bacterium]|nr:FAD/NAD(P)-binding protein [Acidimicrobiales bacterium]
MSWEGPQHQRNVSRLRTAGEGGGRLPDRQQRPSASVVMIEVAIIGLGPWGLCVLERIVDRVQETGALVRAHVVDPGVLGGGVYALDQPDFLVLNNPCGQLSLSAAVTDPESSYAVSLYEWVTSRGYRWVGDECRQTTEGRPIEPTDYLPRRLMGEYLTWFFDTMVAEAPAKLDVVRHPTLAVDILPVVGGRERVVLESGQSLIVDHVVLTSGHTFNEEDPDEREGLRFLRPYPVQYFTETVSPGDRIAVSGMGLVAFDIIAALTTGRGGSFEAEGEDGAGLRYLPSGQEPTLELYSRSGIPPSAKSATGIDATGDYMPVVCTRDALSAITHRPDGSRRQADFRSDLLPLLTAEMQVRFYVHSAFLSDGEDAAKAVRRRLEAAWSAGTFDETVGALAECHGVFDPALLLDGAVGGDLAGADDYEQRVRAALETDLRDAEAPGGSPTKAAQEVTRILRDDIRAVVEFGGLSLESYVDFQSKLRPKLTRFDAGPPPMRIQQLIALMDAGVVRIRLGPNPAVRKGEDGRPRLDSTALAEPVSVPVDAVVRGHLDLPSLTRSASTLLKRLYFTGRLTQLSYHGTDVGSVAISEDFHPFDVHGRLQPHISVLGVLTEGTRYFTHYLPSPRSRLRAVLDAQATVESVIT